jgi:hypothetical protein
MIHCPACKTTFSPRFRVCPRCSAYDARLEERLEYLTDSAAISLENGAKPAEVESMLIEEGVSPLEACEIVSGKLAKIKGAARRYGLIRLFGGLGLEALAMVLAAIGWFALPSRFGLRMLIAGLGLGLAGAFPLLFGVYSMLTGREERFDTEGIDERHPSA